MNQTQTKQTTDINETYADITAQGTLHVKRLMPAPIDIVWSYITDSEKSALWLNTINTPFREKGPYDVTFQNQNLTDEAVPEEFGAPYNAKGEILIVEPPTKLSYTWKMGETDTIVLFELTPQGDQTLLSITHSNIPAPAMTNVGPGWHTHLARLIAIIAGTKPTPFWETFTTLKSQYEPIIGAK
ncbi:MAG: SRPBCC family protein [Alphaproteobacteria bacterium]|nr:SRPBCC family protein [Alphaproteobacteria bacterium]